MKNIILKIRWSLCILCLFIKVNVASITSQDIMDKYGSYFDRKVLESLVKKQEEYISAQNLPNNDIVMRLDELDKILSFYKNSVYVSWKLDDADNILWNDFTVSFGIIYDVYNMMQLNERKINSCQFSDENIEKIIFFANNLFVQKNAQKIRMIAINNVEYFVAYGNCSIYSLNEANKFGILLFETEWKRFYPANKVNSSELNSNILSRSNNQIQINNLQLRHMFDEECKLNDLACCLLNLTLQWKNSNLQNSAFLYFSRKTREEIRKVLSFIFAKDNIFMAYIDQNYVLHIFSENFDQTVNYLPDTIKSDNILINPTLKLYNLLPGIYLINSDLQDDFQRYIFKNITQKIKVQQEDKNNHPRLAEYRNIIANLLSNTPNMQNVQSYSEKLARKILKNMPANTYLHEFFLNRKSLLSLVIHEENAYQIMDRIYNLYKKYCEKLEEKIIERAICANCPNIDKADQMLAEMQPNKKHMIVTKEIIMHENCC